MKYELYNDVDGYQDSGTLEQMKEEGRLMITDDKENKIDWLQPYWIQDENGNIVYQFYMWKKKRR